MKYLFEKTKAMKKTKTSKLAFTLIELVVVIGIITIVTVWWVSNFSKFIDKQETKQKLDEIKIQIESYEKSIQNYQNYDTKILFSTSTGSYWYQTNTNTFDIENASTLTLDSNISYTGSISNTNSTQSWNFHLYNNEKRYDTFSMNPWETKNWNFDTFKNYSIQSFSGSWELNNINIHYFSEPKQNKDEMLQLTSINSKEDQTGTSYQSIQVYILWKKKTISWVTTSWVAEENIPEIYLFFYHKGTEDFITLTTQ